MMILLLLLIIAGVWSLQPAHISVSAPPARCAFSCIGITFLPMRALHDGEPVIKERSAGHYAAGVSGGDWRYHVALYLAGFESLAMYRH